MKFRTQYIVSGAIKIRCPYCSSAKTKVIDKRFSEGKNRRRRECLKCGKRFTTYEIIETTDFIVIKKDGRREKFDRNKLKTSIIKACEKRPISLKTIERVVNEIEEKLRSLGKKEIKTKLIGDLVMEKLRSIDEVAYVRFASYYKHFTDIESFEKELRKLRVVGERKPDSTEISLLVSTPREFSPWDRNKIKNALIRETGISSEDAEDIAIAVEKKVFSSGIRTISVGLIRELVNNELFVRGYQKKLEVQEIIGMPAVNIREVIFNKTLENANIAHNNPEAVNLALAENSLKQFALKEVFSKDVREAHLSGMIHIHNLGFPTRVYCSAHSLEYIKKYGLKLLNLATSSTPAKHASTLVGHLNTFLASMQAYYAGALGIGFLNIFFAPLLRGMSYREIKQVAQYLIFSCSQNAFSRGGQTLFIDFNIHLGVPDYLKNVPAIGAGGKYMIKKGDDIEYVNEVPRDKEGYALHPKNGKVLTYGDFEKEAQIFARALLDVWREGDAEGKPFPFPKCDLHIDQKCFEDKVQLDLLKYACLIASENGTPYFVFDRGEGAHLAQCCRLRTKITDMNMITHPESQRFCGFQNVTINLPQAAYRSGKPMHGNVEKTIEEIYKAMEIAMKAHLQKKKWVEKLMEPGGPMWQVGMKAFDGKPYIELDKATYIIGLVGLNECVKYIIGKELHESEDAYKTGLKIISAMYLKTKEFEKEYGLKVCLEETPAESSSLRLARIDLRMFPFAKDYVRGNKETLEVYYTNSIHFSPDAPIDIIQRIVGQSKFNPLTEAGAITHVFLGEQKPDPEAIFSLVKNVWEKTQSAQITISPEFTICYDCHSVSRGYKRFAHPTLAEDGGEKMEEARCPKCGSKNVVGMSRVVGYYTIINNWNQGKKAEFKDRQRGNYKLPDKISIE
ncbi:MAG: anaerobic ribonucleoside-triphosphate reductase [Candidatus Aenigmatarchaeota archaeon]